MSLSGASNTTTDMKVDILNVRGIGDDDNKLTLVEDADKHKIDILTLSETHIPEEECLYEIELAGKKQYILYGCNDDGNHHQGVGFLIKKELEPDFKRIILLFYFPNGTHIHEYSTDLMFLITFLSLYAQKLLNCNYSNYLIDQFY